MNILLFMLKIPKPQATKNQKKEAEGQRRGVVGQRCGVSFPVIVAELVDASFY